MADLKILGAQQQQHDDIMASDLTRTFDSQPKILNCQPPNLEMNIEQLASLELKSPINSAGSEGEIADKMNLKDLPMIDNKRVSQVLKNPLQHLVIGKRDITTVS